MRYPLDVYVGQVRHAPTYIGSCRLKTRPVDQLPEVLAELAELGVFTPHGETVPDGGGATNYGWYGFWLNTVDIAAWPHDYPSSADTPWAVTYASGSAHIYRRGRLYLTVHVNRVNGRGGDPAPFPQIGEHPDG